MRRWDLGLALLAVLTVALSVLALQHVEVLPSASGGADAPDDDPVSVTTPVSAEDATATSAPPPDDTEATTEAPEALDPAGLGELVDADAATVVVLGDSTSNSRAEWVELWAEGLGDERAVTIAHWDETGDDGYTEEVALTEGEGEVAVWSGSITGATAAAAAARVEELVPVDPDVVLLSFGRDDDAEEVAAGLDDLLAGVRETAGDVPVGVVVQPGGEEDVTEAVRSWAEAAEVAVVDVDTAWQEQTPDIGVNDADGNITAEAAQLWADRVAEALAG